MIKQYHAWNQVLAFSCLLSVLIILFMSVQILSIRSLIVMCNNELYMRQLTISL